MASPKYRAVHHALDAIQAGEMAVAAHFGYDRIPGHVQDMRGRAWGVQGTKLMWWPPGHPAPGPSMTEKIVCDECGEPRVIGRDGFTLVLVEGEPPFENDIGALIFDNADATSGADRG
jgi:hypothetical protein